ncbi:MAG: ribosome recycling factor [Candidatus Aminicenantes bacterium]|nr:ribosome recycling factor [Candidatus Aminicenantes bacterium]MDH5466574.1 ribosome recycling factor [Candidatus Aminicenantes bacterium]MDH5705178.1 ribosome recycling factor [Candidatus Aminicenantes bacterium]
MVKNVLVELEKRMKVSVEHFRKDLSKLRTGRANLSIFEDIKVDYYGSLTPINQVATLGVPDPTLITVQPWDPSTLDAIDKAIRNADLGLNPVNDGKMLKVPIPPMDEERRQEMAKHIKKLLEDEKTALRIMRRESKEAIEKLEEDDEITEDDKFWGFDKLQEVTDEYTKRIEELADAKEKEVLEV